MTDWLVAQGMLSKGSRHQPPTAAGIAAAGGDLVMPGGRKDYKNILEGLKTGKLTRKQLEINATRVVRMARKLNKRKGTSMPEEVPNNETLEAMEDFSDCTQRSETNIK